MRSKLNPGQLFSLFVPIFEEHEIFMLGLVFLSQFLAIETIVFSKKILCLIEDIGFLKSNLKTNFTSDDYCKGYENCKFGHALDYFMRTLKILSIILKA